jgi:hypothetical protein
MALIFSKAGNPNNLRRPYRKHHARRFSAMIKTRGFTRFGETLGRAITYLTNHGRGREKNQN